MNGIIAVDKPQEFTSFDVCAKLRGIFGTKKIGHGGTLDPMATGVLPIFVGKAARAVDMMPDTDKEYIAGFSLGLSSDTEDIWGNTAPVSERAVSREELEAVLPRFRGDIMQIPPMYSAVSVGGKRLYELARKGIEVERQPRPAHISKLILTEYDEGSRSGKLVISCSKGTYIRTIIGDIGKALSVGGIMTSLVRTRALGFELSECVSIAELQKMRDEGADLSRLLIPVDRVFSFLGEIRLSAAQTAMYRNGVRLDASRVKRDGEGRYRIYSSDGEFLGLAFERDGLIIQEKNF